MNTIINVTLSSYNMGDATEADYDRWAAFVAGHIDARSGLAVEVDQARFGEAGDDVIGNANDSERETIREAIAALWDEWCAEGARATNGT